MSTLVQRVEGALSTVYDPCSVSAGVPLDVIEMGLVTRLEVDPRGRVAIALCTTSPLCTLIAGMAAEVERAVSALPGVTRVHVSIDGAADWSEARLSLAARGRLAARRARSRAEVPVEPLQWKRSE
jgi:metal-sulfur cluster biosynthetic enzyme